MLLEGILVHKQAYKERDVIASFLLRSGEIISGYMYGGQGGGKSVKSDILQLGYALRFKAHDFKNQSQTESRTYKLSEWSIIWQHEKIRNGYQAFIAMTYFCELHKKLAPPVHNLSEIGQAGDPKHFSCLSNSIYAIDQAPDLLSNIIRLMLRRLIYSMGILPDAAHCCFCGIDLSQTKSFLFYEEGQASCPNCLADAGNHPGAWIDKGFYQSFENTLKMKFMDALRSNSVQATDELILEKYLWQHFHIKKEHFKSLNL